MNNPDNLEQLYRQWMNLAQRCSAWAGADADEAVSAALDVALKKPIRLEQAARVYRNCLQRFLSDRIHQEKGGSHAEAHTRLTARWF
jgi:hypothetical protein